MQSRSKKKAKILLPLCHATGEVLRTTDMYLQNEETDTCLTFFTATAFEGKMGLKRWKQFAGLIREVLFFEQDFKNESRRRSHIKGIRTPLWLGHSNPQQWHPPKNCKSVDYGPLSFILILALLFLSTSTEPPASGSSAS